MSATADEIEELLPEDDREFLATCGRQTSVHKVADGIVIVFARQAFAKYQPQVAELLIKVPPGYPATRLDMFWTYPTLALPNGGVPETAGVFEEMLGRVWQRWSRHWPDNAWRAGIDNVRTFLRTVECEIDRGR